MPPLDLYLDDDFTGAVYIPGGLNPMPDLHTTTDYGPAITQLNIPIAGVLVNDVSITVSLTGGKAILLARALFSATTLAEYLKIEIQKNGAALAEATAQEQAPVATQRKQITTFGVDPTPTLNDVYRLKVYSSSGAATLDANSTVLAWAGSPAVASPT